MMPNPNQGTSTPHFAWFHPGDYLAALRNGFDPTQTNIKGALAPKDIDGGLGPTKPTKRPKTTSNDDGPSKEFQSKKSKRGRRNLNNFPSYESNMDSSGIVAPFCSCTGVPRQCHRWCSGGWQSLCCTTNISEFPLPMSITKPGSRTLGRKMSKGAYDKLLRKLADEGFDLSQPIDLKNLWARHGTNKYAIKR